MGCQFEPQGAALNAIHDGYAARGVFLCGLDRIEHPYDVGDYLRHFGLKFPVLCDLNEESPAKCFGALGSVAILDRNHQRVTAGGKSYFDPLEAKGVLDKLLSSERSGSAGEKEVATTQPTPANEESVRPEVTARNWTAPARLGLGQYPRLVCFGGDKALCVWVAGEAPTQQLAFALFSGTNWEPSAPIPAGEDAHGPALDVDAEGRPALAWAQKDPEGYRVYVSAFLGPGWRKPAPVSPSGSDAFRPDIFCPPAGEMVVTWYAWKTVELRDYPKAWWRSIFVTQAAAGHFGPISELARLARGSDDCWDPIITGGGRALQVAWLRDENPPKLFASALGPPGWSPQAAVVQLPKDKARSFRFQSASAVRGQGRRSGLVFELVSPGGTPPFLAGTHVYLMRFGEPGRTQPIPVSSGPGRHLAPVAVETPAGDCAVFWWHLGAGQKHATIRMREFKGRNEAENQSVVLVSGVGDNVYPSACADGSGRLWLAWQAQRGDGRPSIYVAARRAPQER